MEDMLIEKQELISKVIKFTDQLCTASDAREVLEKLASGAKALTCAGWACIAKLEGSECVWEIEFSQSPKWRGSNIKAESCAAGWSMLNKRELLGEEIEAPEHLGHSVFLDTENHFACIIPICAGAMIRSLAIYFEKGSEITETGLLHIRTLVKVATTCINALYWQNEYQQLENGSKNESAEIENEFDSYMHSISHDLSAPLRAIRGFVQILQEDKNKMTPDEAQGITKRIVDNTNHASELVNDLQWYYQSSRRELVKLKVKMQLLAEEVCFKLYNAERRRHISFGIRNLLPADADPRHMRELFEILISNAMKFTSKVEKAEIEITSFKAEGEIIYKVRDNGAGFPVQNATKLFGVFQRLHSRKDFEGTGMGLAIASRIVKRHGGKIWAEGEENKGASFYFSLPVEED